MIENVDHLIVAVEDLDAAENNYKKIFGINPVWKGVHNELGTSNVIFNFENINEDLLKLGLVKEFSEKDLHCHSYNLKTYNIKRDWNNPKGWANPENFNKYRW